MADTTEWVRLILEGKGSPQLKEMASTGMLPFSPHEMMQVLEVLSRDDDEIIRGQSLETTRSLPHSTLVNVARDPGASPGVLKHLFNCFPKDEEVLSLLVTNPSTDEEVLISLAESQMKNVLEALGNNQDRLRKQPELMETLLQNPSLPAHLKGYLMEESRRREAAEKGWLELEVSHEEEEEEEIEFQEVLVKDFEKEDAAVTFDKRKEVQEVRRKSVLLLVRQMTVGEKLVLAIRGNKEVRHLLIRDTNKQVALKVLESPRLIDSEVEVYARMANVSDDVLRGISKKRDWVRRYSIVKGLIFNAKTPVGVTIPLINKLSVRDLGLLSKNRNIPEVVRRTAGRLHSLRRSRQKGSSG